MTVSDCKRQGADQPSTRAGWSVPLLFTTMSVLKHFVDVHYYIVSIFARFLLYCVYVFVLCSPYLEDNKVSIYLSIYFSCLRVVIWLCLFLTPPLIGLNSMI